MPIGECMHASVCEHGGGWCEDSCPDYEEYNESEVEEEMILWEIRQLLYNQWFLQIIRKEIIYTIREILVEGF